MKHTASCPSCSRGIFHDDSFCAWCGTAVLTRPPTDGPSRAEANATVSAAERETCGSCNSPVLPADLFCASCGARVSLEDEGAGLSESTTAIAKRVTEAANGRYEVIRLLGRGGMGIVLMGRDLDLGRLVAIKVLAPSALTDDSMVSRFQHEARTIASLRHESIVSVYDVGRAGEFYYFVMDFIEGVTLGDVIRTHGPVPVPVAEAVLYQIGSALEYAHGRSNTIVHRDIKPANIMLDREGLAVLMDFGISKASESSSGLTRTGIVMGTPEYMSPEQCRGPTVTHASDQYALGAVVFAMLTGAPPFTGPYYRVLMAHQNEEVPPLSEVRADCPPKLARVVGKMLAKVPGDRYPAVGDVLRELELRPLPRDSAARMQIGELVREAQEASQSRATERASGEGEASAGVATPTSLRIVPHTEELEVGDHVGLSAVVQFPDGNEKTGYDVAWESTDPSIARIDPTSGRLVAVGEGSVVIKAVGGGVDDALSVSVSPPKVARVSITPDEVDIEVGARLQLHAWPKSKNGQTLERPVSWSSSDPLTASVSDDGKLTGRKAGTVSILAHCEGVGGAARINVGAAAAAAPGTDDQATRVLSEEDPRFQETVLVSTPPSGSPASPEPARREAGRRPPSPAAPSSRRWLPVAGVGALVLLLGLAWLGRGALGGAPAVQEIDVMANGAPVGDVPLALAVGDTVPLVATLLAEDGETVEGDVRWASANPAVATVAGGTVVAVGEGTTRITAGSGETETFVSVAVNDAPSTAEETPRVARIVFRNAETGGTVGSLTLERGDPVRLQALPMDEDGDPVPESSVSWTSSSPAVVAVDSRGFVTGIRAGRAEVVASAGDVEQRIPVSVTAPAPPPVPTERAPADGTLELQVLPWADVWVDSRREADEQRSLTLRLSPGSHRLRLTNPNFPQFDTVFTIRSGQTTSIRVRLNRDHP